MGSSNMKFQPGDRVRQIDGKLLLGTIVGHGVLVNDDNIRLAYFVHLDEEFQGYHEATSNYISVMAVDQKSITHAACNWCHGVFKNVNIYDGRVLCKACFEGGY